MYMSGSDGIVPRGDAAIIEIAFVPPRATTARPSSGSSARSYSSPPAPIDRPRHELLAVLRTADHDVAVDRQTLERRARAAERRLLGGVLVGAAEPARARRAPRASVTRAKDSHGAGAALLPRSRGRRLLGGVDTRLTTSSIVRSTFAFSTTGTPSRSARETRTLWMRRMSSSRSRYLAIARMPPVAESRTWKCIRWMSSSAISMHHVDDDRALELGGHEPGHEVHAFEHHRPAFGERAAQRGVDTDADVPRLLEEADDGRVACDVRLDHLPRLEARGSGSPA